MLIFLKYENSVNNSRNSVKSLYLIFFLLKSKLLASKIFPSSKSKFFLICSPLTDYAYNIPNSKLEKSHIDKAEFSLKASQILTLILNIPLIFGDLFENKEKDNWKNFLRLNSIVNIVFAFFYDEKTIICLDSLISKYLNTFKSL